jgi:hypothetical protein
MPMMTNPSRCLLALVLIALAALPAHAADAVFPIGSRVGLAPPAGMEVSGNFFGFEDRGSNAGIVIVTAPPEAYAELERSINAEALKRQGMTFETRENFALAAGKAFLVIARQQVDNVRVRKLMLFASLPGMTALVTAQIPDAAKNDYPDAKIREALRTVTARATIPAEEQLALLPFKVGDLAGFQVSGVIPGRAVMLTDAKPGTPPAGAEPHILIALGASGPVANADRDQFAREMLLAVPDLKSTRVTGSEPLRFGGQQGHQIFGSARDAAGNELSVVQWLRFGAAGYMQMLGVARVDAWRDAYPRFRAVRDGVEPR